MTRRHDILYKELTTIFHYVKYSVNTKLIPTVPQATFTHQCLILNSGFVSLNSWLESAITTSKY